MKKEIIKVVISQEVIVTRLKKFSRQTFGQLPVTKVVPAKKGGAYTRKAKHSQHGLRNEIPE